MCVQDVCLSIPGSLLNCKGWGGGGGEETRGGQEKEPVIMELAHYLDDNTRARGYLRELDLDGILLKLILEKQQVWARLGSCEYGNQFSGSITQAWNFWTSYIPFQGRPCALKLIIIY